MKRFCPSLPPTVFWFMKRRKEIWSWQVGTTPLSFLTQKLLLLNRTLHLWPAALGWCRGCSSRTELAVDFPGRRPRWDYWGALKLRGLGAQKPPGRQQIGWQKIGHSLSPVFHLISLGSRAPCDHRISTRALVPQAKSKPSENQDCTVHFSSPGIIPSKE